MNSATKFILILCSLIVLTQEQLYAQPDQVTIRDLNTYENLTEITEANLQAHPLVGVEVQFTAVVVSYPRSSGLATARDTDEDGVVDEISRIHMFVTDTAAVREGRAGMSIQLIVSDYELMDSFVIGDVVTFVGELTFFRTTSQISISSVDYIGSIYNEFEQFAVLTEPWEVAMDEINLLNDEGKIEINAENYSTYNGSYIALTEASVSNVELGSRPNWAVNSEGSKIYIYDYSLRYRNDRSDYLVHYNQRRESEEPFVPPLPGAIVNISGFLAITGDDPNAEIATDKLAFSLSPFEDGVVWLNGTRFEDGDNLGGGDILEWPNDLEVVSIPPTISNVNYPTKVTSSDDITIEATVVGNDGKTINSVTINYQVNGVDYQQSMTGNVDTYSVTLPTYPNRTIISFYIEAQDIESISTRKPLSDTYSIFVIDDAISTVEAIQKTNDLQAGPSPLEGLGSIAMDLSGLIVSDNQDGVIILQDSAAEWSGIFLERTDQTKALIRGDEIRILSANVVEAEVLSNPVTLTVLTELQFEIMTIGNDIETVIPTITTDGVIQQSNNGELENYEGMVVKFENIELISRDSFGEYTLKTIGNIEEGGAIFNEDIRSDVLIGSVKVPPNFNSTLLAETTMDAYAVVGASFGNPKFHPRNADDFITPNGNAFSPVLDFKMEKPIEGEQLNVDGNIDFSWVQSVDYDNDDIFYQVAFYNPIDSSEIQRFDIGTNLSNWDENYEILDEFLFNLGLVYGDSVPLLWNVWVSDGFANYQIHGDYSVRSDNFFPIYRYVELTRTTNNDYSSEVTINFSVNTAVQQDLGNFEASEHTMQVIGNFNGWDLNNPIQMNAENDSMFTATLTMNANSGDSLIYKFVNRNVNGIFEWDAPDPNREDTRGEFNDRFTILPDSGLVELPMVYFSDIDRAAFNGTKYETISIENARNLTLNDYAEIRGIVTRVTTNFVYLEDETAGIMLFSRPYFSEPAAVNFNQAVQNGEINEGDELSVAGTLIDFGGLAELTRMHAWEVISSGNPLSAQSITLQDVATNGEAYESELVHIERIKFDPPVDTLRSGSIYTVTNESGSQVGNLQIQAFTNTVFANTAAPQGLFNFKGVIKETFINDTPAHVLTPHAEGDLQEGPSFFDASFSIPSFAGLIDETYPISLSLDELGEEAIEGFQMAINFDPEVIQLSLDDAEGTLIDAFSIDTNFVEDGVFRIAGAAVEGLAETGTFLTLNATLLSGGMTDITINAININEKPMESLVSTVNVVLRRCGDVTGDKLVTALDASFVLQHSVRQSEVFPLVALDSTAADVTGNGQITAFDASRILQYEVGMRESLDCISLPLKEQSEMIAATWSLSEDKSTVEVELGTNEVEVFAVQFTVNAKNATFRGVNQLPDDWTIYSNTTSDEWRISMFGFTPLTQNSIQLDFDQAEQGAQPNVSAQILINEQNEIALGELTLGEAPTEFTLNQNYPNPFNPSTNISYSLPQKVDVELTIFNMLGQKVATLVNQSQDAGSYSISWNAASMSSGVYIYRLTAGSSTFTKRMMLIK